MPKKTKQGNVASLLQAPDSQQNDTISEALNTTFNPDPNDKPNPDMPPANVNLDSEELSIEIMYLNNPNNKINKDYPKRLANLYSYAFMGGNFKLVEWLEARHQEQVISDKQINIILK